MSINRNEESILRLPGITPVAGADSKDDDTGAGGGSPGPEVSRQNRTDWAMPLPPSCTGLLLMRPARPGFEVGTAMVCDGDPAGPVPWTCFGHAGAGRKEEPDSETGKSPPLPPTTSESNMNART